MVLPRAMAVVFLVGCGGGPAGSSLPDAAPGPRSCRTFGPLTRDAEPLRTTSGAPFHPQGIVADPEVVFDGARYRMWFTTSDWTAGSVFDATDRVLGTAYVESGDGRTWDDAHAHPADPAHKIDLVLRPGTWDSNGVETVAVARSAADHLLLVHTGDRPDGTYAIGRAVSADGLAWQRDEAPLLLPVAAWEQPACVDPPACTQHVGGVLEPSVVIDTTGREHVWYAGLGLRGSELSAAIGHAWTDDGVQWQRAADPVFSPGPAGAWDEVLVSQTNVVPDPAGGYHLFYQGVSRAQQAMCDASPCTFYTPGSIGHAFSADGDTWVRDPAPLLEPTGADGFFVGGPSAVIRDGRLELFYFGIASRDDANVLAAHLARATATCAEP